LISIEDDATELLTNGKRARRWKRFVPFPGGKQKEFSGHRMADGALNYKDDEELAFFLLRMKKAVETCHAFRRWEGGNNNNNKNLTTGSETLAQLFGSKQRNNHTEIAEHMNL
jgi:hypothetical protein